MKKIISSLALFVLMVGVAGHVPRAYACSCIQPEPPVEAMTKSAAVFAGRVIDIDAPAVMTNTLDQNKITFNASKAWKGVDKNPVYVYSSGSSASCGYEFEVGKEYLVYAYEEDGNLATGLCTRTALLADAAEDLVALGAGEIIEPSTNAPEGANNDTYSVIGGIILIIAIGSVYYFARATRAGKKF
jgi:hypothetical protein